MSYRKTKLIQEKNILLERRYISEQTPTPSNTGNTTPVTTTTTTLSKSLKADIKNLPSCSTIDSKFNPKLSRTEGELQVFQIDGKDFCTKKQGK